MMNTWPIFALKQTENWQFWQEWQKIWISIRWDFCWSLFLNPSSNIVPSLGCFTVEKLERALRLVYSDDESTFEDLLTKDGSFTAHHCNIQTLATELHKVNYIELHIELHLKQFWGNCLQEIIMAIFRAQNLILLFRKLGLY